MVGGVLAEYTVDGVGGGGELVLGVLGVAQQRLQVLVLALAHALHHLVPHDAVDAGDAGHAVLGTHPVRHQRALHFSLTFNCRDSSVRLKKLPPE